jgi:hypothetical protein
MMVMVLSDIVQDVMVPSSDMFRGSHAANALLWYYQATEPAAQQLDKMFRISFPEQYPKYHSAFDAGQWVRYNPGPWLGRAIIHKAQILMHRDADDPPDSPAAIFNSGLYKGGYLYLPDLKLKLRSVNRFHKVDVLHNLLLGINLEMWSYFWRQISIMLWKNGSLLGKLHRKGSLQVELATSFFHQQGLWML